MPMTAKLWTINGLATELGRDRRFIGEALSGVAPDGKEGGRDGWLMKTAIAALSGGGSGEALDKNEQLARKAKEEADKIEMENRVRRGELLERSSVDAAVIAAFTRVRGRLLGIPTKLAPQMAQDIEPNEAEAAIRAAVVEVLQELSDVNVANADADLVEVVEGADAAA